MDQNGYLYRTVDDEGNDLPADPFATVRVVTVEYSDVSLTLSFAPGEPIQIVVPQDTNINVSLHDESTDPHWTNSVSVTDAFKSTDRDTKPTEQLRSPGKLARQFTGEVK